MKKTTLVKIIGISLVAMSSLSLAIATMAWFVGPGGNLDKEKIDGEIGLRGYFYAGDGSDENPFEIVTPTHMYNFSRLQNLGIFAEKKHFQIGHKNNEVYQVITGYSDGNPIWGDVLDMDGVPIPPIGSEATPFVGTFNGHNITLTNLEIRGYPEDIGVFGYVSYQGSVNGLICQDLNVCSLGYNPSSSDETYQLFHPEIDDLFAEHGHRFVENTSLSFFAYNGSAYVETTLKHENGLSGVTYSNINRVTNVVLDDNSQPTTIFNGYFLPTFPNVAGDPFTYSWRSSSPLISEETVIDIDGVAGKDKAIMINMEKLRDAGNDDKGFNNTTSNMQINSRLSLYAMVEVDGYVYSRVIQSYTLEFNNNSTGYESGGYSVSIFCDYVASEDGVHRVTNYHHGNNIGFLVGHLDGTLTNSYVFRGSFNFNDGSNHVVPAETQTGLVGEVGANVVNEIDPEFNVSISGEIGVMNFTRIYKGIRSDIAKGETIYGGKETDDGTTYKYIGYDDENHKNTGATSHFDLYSNYLRHTDTATPHYITSVTKDIPQMNYPGSVPAGENALTWHPYTVPNDTTVTELERFNSIDFLWNNVIEDKTNEDRGLGVFKIVTPYNSDAKTNPYGECIYQNFGDCIVINGASHSDIFYSTAEYVHRYGGAVWGDDAGQIRPLRASTLPSYSDVGSFDYPFSRDYNYVFKMNLTQNVSTGGKNYLYNTDSPFLTNYLKSHLIDKYGNSIAPGNTRFGFMFRSAENSALTSLSSYMPISKPGNKQQYTTQAGTVYYPSNSIVFKIANENGANVSVVGNTRNISIYGFNSTSSSADVTEEYTMLCENTSEVDSHRYFNYDYSTGVTSDETVHYGDDEMGDGGCLYAHIFKLPQGEYVIGKSTGYPNDDTTKARLYYLAVQGQTDATIDTTVVAETSNTLSNVDFLLTSPVDNPIAECLKAQVTLTANFNTERGQFNVGVKDYELNKYLQMSFLDDPMFVTYLFTYDYKASPHYYINNTPYERTTYVYPR